MSQARIRSVGALLLLVLCPLTGQVAAQAPVPQAPVESRATPVGAPESAQVDAGAAPAAAASPSAADAPPPSAAGTAAEVAPSMLPQTAAGDAAQGDAKSVTPAEPASPAALVVEPPLAAAAPGDENIPTFIVRARKSRLAPAELTRYGTGSRVNAPIEEIPASVSVVDERSLREKGAQTPEQALTHVPGLNFASRYGGFGLLRIRGFQPSILIDGLRDTRLAIINEVPMGALFDLERIEILRGPAAVLYGYGSVGGVLNFIRRQPSRTAQYTLDFGVGTPEALTYHLGAQGPLGEYFSYRVDAGRQSRTDFRGALVERSQASAAVLFSPVREHNLSLRFGFEQSHSNTDVGIPTVEDPNRPGMWTLPPNARLAARYNTRHDYLDYQRLTIEGNYRWDLSDLTYLQARANYVHDHYSYLAAETITYVAPADMMQARVDREYFGFVRGWRPFVAQVELHSELITGPIRHQLVFGYELSIFRGKSSRGNTGDETPGSVDFTHPEDNSPYVSLLRRTAADYYSHDTHSIFAFDHMHVLPGLIATGGVRFDTVRSEVERRLIDSETDRRKGGEGNIAPIRAKPSALTGQFGLVYTPHPIFTAYASWSTGFKPLFVRPDGAQSRDLSPERSQQLEAGARVRVRAGKHVLDFDGAAYTIERRNMLISRGMDDYDQAGKVTSRGFDLALHYAAPSVVSVDLSYIMTRARFDEFSSEDPVSGEQRSLAGKQPEFVPLHSGMAWLRIALTEQVGFGIGGRLLGKQYADQENRLAMHSYALLDASVWFQADRFAFNLSVRNLLDKHDYFTSSINSWALNPQITPGPGREILASLRVTL